MTWVDHKYFTTKWIERAESDNRDIDKADQFIALWIAFNGWMRGKFGERMRDGELIEEVKKDDLKKVFDELITEESFVENLNKLKTYPVENMKTNAITQFDGTFESLIGIIYQIRCNLFHGRKDSEGDEKDFELVCLSYDILLPLFKEYLRKSEFAWYKR